MFYSKTPSQLLADKGIEKNIKQHITKTKYSEFKNCKFWYIYDSNFLNDYIVKLRNRFYNMQTKN